MPYSDPEKNKACIKKYHEDHKEEIVQYRKERYQKKKEHINAITKKSYYANHEKNKEKLRKYYQEHKAEFHAYMLTKRGNLRGKFTSAEWRKIQENQGNKCLDCGIECQLTIGHLVPVSKGGLNIKENIIGQCLACNKRQFTKIHPLATERKLV